jgi:hypothetical protein
MDGEQQAPARGPALEIKNLIAANPVAALLVRKIVSDVLQGVTARVRADDALILAIAGPVYDAALDKLPRELFIGDSREEQLQMIASGIRSAIDSAPAPPAGIVNDLVAVMMGGDDP